jgi:hypothetical protein
VAQPDETPLEGWKDIAKHLGRSKRTAQRSGTRRGAAPLQFLGRSPQRVTLGTPAGRPSCLLGVAHSVATLKRTGLLSIPTYFSRGSPQFRLGKQTTPLLVQH